MLTENKKTSLSVRSQLPGFIRDNPDYNNFVLFLEAYYEWLEQDNNVLSKSKNLLSYKDIDKTTSEFLDYFKNDFLPIFPKESLISQEMAIKCARELYQNKGVPAAYKFLFKILYNSDFEYFYTKDVVLKPSDGVWYVSKSIKLSTTDTNFLKVNNYRLFGETSKTLATIENAVLNGNKTDIYISDITRTFESGETIRVVDVNNQDVLFDGQPLKAKIIGQVNQIKIDPLRRGLLYETGDPVIVYGGLNPNTANPVGATAEVGETTSGSIERINVVDGGFGYTIENTLITIDDAPGALASVGSIDPNPSYSANVNFIPLDVIAAKQDVVLNESYYNFSHMASANANTKIVDALNFRTIFTNPISSVFVNNGGGGLRKVPKVSAESTYSSETGVLSNLADLGILAPIQILDGGHGYQVNDTITFTGGTGLGAYANVTSVTSNGSITRIEYVNSPETNKYPKGGLGYKLKFLPGVTVQSSNVLAANASIYVPGILGSGADFSVITDRTGAVTTINILNAGEDYVSAPNISLKVQDIAVSNVYITNLPRKDDIIYQGTDVNTATYRATVNSVSLLIPNEYPAQSIWNLRVFEYSSKPNTSLQLTIDRNINMIPANTNINNSYNKWGYRTYGDGGAKGKSTFLNGLSFGQGQYLSTKGHPSSYDVLQSEIYNNYTYIITVEKEIEKYRDILMNLLHPTGMKVLGRYALKSNANFSLGGHTAVYQAHPLSYYTGYTGSHAHIYTDFENKSNNIIYFDGLSGANLENFIFENESIISIKNKGIEIRSEVLSVNSISNNITISSNVWLTYSNVAVVSGQESSNVINITDLITDSYNVINNGIYSNKNYPLRDIIYVGDTILVDNNTSKLVSAIDYANGTIILSTNLTSNVSNSYLSVNRTFSANSSPNSDQIHIYGPIGQVYIPLLLTEDGQELITESGDTLILG